MFGIKTTRHILTNMNRTIANLATTSDKVLTTGETTHKTIVTTLGGMGGVKGVIDIAEDLVCQDYLCLTIDCIGVCADTVTCATSFLPGLNVTSSVTIPISTSCKFFRWCCSKSIFNVGCRR